MNESIIISGYRKMLEAINSCFYNLINEHTSQQHNKVREEINIYILKDMA